MMAMQQYSSGLGEGMYADQAVEQENILGRGGGVRHYMGLSLALLCNGGGVYNSSLLQLGSLLRGELAAVEAYERAIRLLEKENEDKQKGAYLLKNLYSHQKRAALLRGEITKLGGEPVWSSGIWGGMARVLQRCATAVDALTALELLAKGEAYGTAYYQKRRNKVTEYVAGIIQGYLLPEQLCTQSAIEFFVHRCHFELSDFSLDTLSSTLHER